MFLAAAIRKRPLRDRQWAQSTAVDQKSEVTRDARHQGVVTNEYSHLYLPIKRRFSEVGGRDEDRLIVDDHHG